MGAFLLTMEWLCACAKLQASASFALYFDLKSHDFNDMVGVEHYVPFKLFSQLCIDFI
jgi:hypothetical protein